MTSPNRSLSALLLAVPLCAACALFSPRSAPLRYAVLVPLQELPGAALAPVPSGTLRAGLGPVTLPDYLRRPSIVSRQEHTRLVPSDTERWAEPLDRAVERVLAMDLQHVLGVARVNAHPWYETERPDVQIEIAFTRFEHDDSGKVIVAASWSLRRLDGSQPRIERESHLERSAGMDGAAIALALSRALADLCGEIALAWPKDPEGTR